MNTFTNLSPEDTVYLLKLPYHLAHANMVDELCTLLTDFDFIDHKMNGTKKSSKACVASFPAWRLVNVFKGAAASGQERGDGSPPRMGSQPGGLFQLGQGLCLNLVPFDHKISTSTPQLLIEDYNLAIQIHIPQLTQNNLQLIQSAIQLSANILTEDHTQLAGQLLGRLLSYETPEIQTLLQQAKQYKGSPWLRPLISSLTNPDASKAVSVASDRTLKIWDLHTGGAIASFTADSTLLTCTVAPENTTIVAGDILGCVHFLRLEDIDGVKEE